MAGKKKRPIEQYEHKESQRLNNPPVGLVDAKNDPESGRKAYQYDPHLDPQLVWAGKAERNSFEVPTVSLHVHERIEPRTIIEAARKKNGTPQGSLFSMLDTAPIRDAIEFYQHAQNWSNRLIAGDSLLVMNSLLEKEGLAGQVQMIYIDPPYGIKYGSNFQPFVNKRDVKDGKDEDLTAEPETIKAFRDTWELGIHSYLTYMRDRLLLAKELLSESGSIFVQISNENLHHLKEIMDESFGNANFVSIIPFVTTSSQTSKLLSTVCDFIVWYSKSIGSIKYRQLFSEKELGGEGSSKYNRVILKNGQIKSLNDVQEENNEEIPKGSRVFRIDTITSQSGGNDSNFEVEFKGNKYRPRSGYWKTNRDGFKNLIAKNRIAIEGTSLGYIRYIDDFPAFPIANVWTDFASVQSRADPKVYVVQTATKTIQRCMLMSTDPGDLVLDPTCGSGTTAYVAEQWGRRWITCDTSRVSITLAKQRIMTANYNYYELAHPKEGISSGFKYKTVPHITLKSIANNEPPGQETLYDQPSADNSKARVTGPFTVEAVPSPVVKGIGEVTAPRAADLSISRSGETLRQTEWKDELYRSGIRAKGGKRMEFTRVETMSGTRWLHCDAETKEGERAVISFGPVDAPLEQKQVERAIEESKKLVPKPKIVAFAAFHFDPEAAKDIDETIWPGMTLLKVQMNTDLLTEDLKKKRSSNESFWLIGQPDIVVKKLKDKEHKDEYQVEVLGFDYYNPKTGTLESGGKDKIAMWLLDTDYDGRSLYPRQVFFPMAGENEGWARLARNLKAEIDEDLIEAYRGTLSLPFPAGEHKRVAVKIVDDRGIESLRIIDLE